MSASDDSLTRIIHRFEDEELLSFNGKPKATVCLSHRAIEAAVALPLNEFGNHRSIAMTNAGWRVVLESQRFAQDDAVTSSRPS